MSTGDDCISLTSEAALEVVANTPLTDFFPKRLAAFVRRAP